MNIRYKKFNKYYSRGFTIIETLVAITILMIAVAGPLVVASKGLNSALYARDQIIASYLAQESMETIKNVRDRNEDTGASSGWLSGLTTAGCTPATVPCDIDAISRTSASEVTGGASISYNSSSGYVSSGGATPTIFKRYYLLLGPGGSGTCDTSSTGVECEAHVVVTWNEGTIPYDVTLESELVNNPNR